MKTTQRGFIVPLMLVIIALFLAGGGAYVYVQNKQTNQPAVVTETTQATSTTQSSNSPITGWGTYINDSLGFSIQYPDDAKPSTELNDQWNRMTGFGEPRSTKYFTVMLFKDTASDMGVKFGYLEAIIVSKDIKLGGVSGYKAISTTGYGDAGDQGSPYVEFAARHNGDIYHVIFYGDASVSTEEQQILSTFKFIPSVTPTSIAQTSDSQTTDWKTYTNAQYGFSFQYPPILILKKEGETIPAVNPHQWWARFQNANGKDFQVDVTENTSVDINAISVHTKFNGDVKTQSVMIGEKRGIRFDTSDEAVSVITVRTSIGNHELQIAFDASYSELINSILSTFKFNP